MSGVSNDPWSRIRALRAAPPLLAEDPPRRAVFSAALQQSEELFRSARTAGPPSKPLPLFYALSQAGRAITAAHHVDKDSWAIRGHGLTVVTDTSDIRNTTVSVHPKARGNDAASSVAAALSSPLLEGSMTVAALTAALPELADCDQLRGDALPALPIAPDVDIPPWNRRGLTLARGSVSVPLKEGAGDAEFDALMARYAGIDGYEILVPFSARTGVTTRVCLRWPNDRRRTHGPVAGQSAPSPTSPRTSTAAGTFPRGSVAPTSHLDDCWSGGHCCSRSPR